MTRDHVRFRSPRFRPLKPEDEQANPGRYGEELAEWLTEHLSSAGLAVSEPQLEDWGWFLTFGGPEAMLFLGCGNVYGEEEQWLSFLRDRRGLLGRILGRARRGSEAKARVVRALDAALRDEPTVTEIEWFAEGPDRREINHAPRPE